MSKADEIFIQNCRDILSSGTWDTDREVRPRWGGRRTGAHDKEIWHCEPVRPERGVSHPHYPTHILEVCGRRAFVDMAGEEQQRARPAHARVGCMGG